MTRWVWSTRDVLVVTVLAAVFGFLYWALVQAWGGLQVLMGPFGDLAQNALMGGWITVAPLAVFIVRKPGSGIVAEIVAAFVEFAFLGSPAGPMLLIAGLVQGGGAELAFAVTRYRRYGWPTFLLAGVGGVTGNFLWAGTMYDWWTQDLLALRVVLQLLSGLLLTGVVAKVLAEALLRTGVLDDLAAGRARRAVDVDTGPDEDDEPGRAEAAAPGGGRPADAGTHGDAGGGTDGADGVDALASVGVPGADAQGPATDGSAGEPVRTDGRTDGRPDA